MYKFSVLALALIKYLTVIQNTIISKKNIRKGKKHERKNGISLSFLVPIKNTFLRSLSPGRKELRKKEKSNKEEKEGVEFREISSEPSRSPALGTTGFLLPPSSGWWMQMAF